MYYFLPTAEILGYMNPNCTYLKFNNNRATDFIEIEVYKI